jgi:hypothetical protein
MERTTEGSVGAATLWMVVLSVLLFWLPPIGPVVAGFVGGRKAGGVGPAVLAATIPAVLAAVLFFLLSSLFALPVVGGLVGAGVLVVVLVESVPLFVGAALGGATAP